MLRGRAPAVARPFPAAAEPGGPTSSLNPVIIGEAAPDDLMFRDT